MNIIKRPMLASKLTLWGALKYPILGSPKFDGIRALTRVEGLVSRKLKPIPNDHVRELASGLPENMDGELMIPSSQFNVSSGSIMRKEGRPDVKYHVFDYVKNDISKPATARAKELEALLSTLDPMYKEFIVHIKQVEITCEEELLDYEELCIEAGHEGVMLRSPSSPYKEGRSSEAEGYLLKLKRMEDSEAIIEGFEEMMHNTNPLEVDALGYSKRSQAKAGMVPAGTLGKFYVRDIHTKVEFEIGTGEGLDDVLRADVWKNQGKYIGKIVKYRYQKHGTLNKPRIPIFWGFRHTDDMD